jgi:hypothetical protein
MAWPDVPRLAFGEGLACDLNANVAWVQSRTRDMYGYVEGYRRAAIALFEYVDTSRASPDYMLFPLAFAWRHYVEIALKDIIAAGRELAGEEWGFPKGHNLLDLWRVARPYIAELGDPAAPELENVENNLIEFDRIDHFGDGFRYPLNHARTGPSLQNPPASVSLRLLHEALEAIATFFLGVRAEQSYRSGYISEMEAQQRREYASEMEAQQRDYDGR